MTSTKDSHEPRCAHEFFTATAHRVPDAVAVETDDRAVTYRELNAAADRLAHRLRAEGAGPETLVAVLLDRGIDAVTAILAVHKAGGAYLPLSPTAPPARLALILADAAPALVLTESAHEGLLPATGSPRRLLLDQLADAPDSDPIPPIPLCGQDDLAWVIYTSGSTGTPKGVAVSHRGVGILVRAQQALFTPAERDRVLHFFSPTFDASVWELLTAFQAGATLRIMPEGGLPADFGKFLTDARITLATLPPSVVSAIDERYPLPDLRVLAVGAEACPPAVVSRWGAGRVLWNVYGPTETTVATLAHRTLSADTGRGQIPIGAPFDGVTAHILDDALNPVAPGERGELCLGGPMVTRGYVGAPALTARAFVPDPFATEPGARLYRTGDVCWRDEDGAICYGGRLDRQVKIRGYRVDTGEVEAALRRAPTVRDAVVVAASGADGLPARLVAYVVPDGSTDPAELTAALTTELPHYMVPSVIVPIDAFPLNGNGKIDREALPAPPGGTTYVPPATTTERRLATLWQSLLGVPDVGATDSFFALGGHSLLAGRLGARILAEFGVELTMRDLYQAPRLTEFAATVDRAVATGGDRAGPVLTAELRTRFARRRVTGRPGRH